MTRPTGRLPVTEGIVLAGATITGWLASSIPVAAAVAAGSSALLAFAIMRRSNRVATDEAAAARFELEAAEMRFRDFADATGDFFWETDEQLRFTWFSPRRYGVTGFAPDSMIGRRREDGANVSAAPEEWKQHLHTLAEHGEFRDFEYERLDASGGTRIMRVSGVPRRHPDGRFAGYRGSGRDVTTERAQRRRARRAEDRFHEAIDRVPEGVALFDADDVLVACNAGYAAYFVDEADPTRCIGRTFTELFRARLAANLHQPGEELEAIVRERVATHREGNGSPVNIVLADGRTLVLRDYVSADDGRMVLVSDISDLIASRLALRTSDQRLRDFSLVAADWFWETDENLRFTYLSERFETLTGLKRSDYLGRSRRQAAGSVTPSPGLELIDAACTRHEHFRDMVYARTLDDGTQRHFRVSGMPVHDDQGRFEGYRGSATDVTASVTNAQRLRAAETRLVAALEGSVDGIAVFDADDQLVLCNTVYSESFFAAGVTVEAGLTFERLVRDNVTRGLLLTSGHDEAWISNRIARHAVADGTPVEVIRADGSWTQARDFRTDEGGTLVVITDITEQKVREAALARSEQRLRDYAETAVDWFWETGPDLRLTYVSDRFWESGGHGAEQVLGRRITRVGTIVSGAEPSGEVLADIRARRGFRDLLMRFDEAPEAHRFQRVSGRPHYDDDGRFTGYRGSGTDITAEIVAAKRSAALETRLASAIGAIRDGFALFDVEDRLVVFNDTWRDYSPETAPVKVAGASFESIIRAEVAVGLIEGIEDNETDYVARRLAEHRAPGEPVERRYSTGRWLRITEARTPDGECVLIAADVTALKLREAEIARSEARFRAFAEASGDWFWEMDTAGRLTAVTGTEHLSAPGLRLEAGQRLEEATSENTDSPRWADLIRRREAGLPIDEFMFQLTGEAGEQVEVALSGSAVISEDGSCVGYRGVARDVTVRRGIERLLRNLASAPAHTGLQQLMESTVERLAGVFDIDLAFIALLAPGTPELAETRAVWHHGRLAGQFSYELDGTPCMRALSGTTSLLVPTGVVDAFPRDEMLVDLGLESYFGVALTMSDGTPMGILVLADSEPMNPSALLAPLPEVVASRIAAELERERAEARLADSERTLRSIFENAPVVLELKDSEGRYQRVSPPFERVYGVEPGALTGLTPTRALSPDIGAAIEQADRAVLATGVARASEESVHSADGTRTLLVQRFPILDASDNVLGVGSAATDISAQKHAEGRARAAYDLLLTAIENVNEGFVLFDAEDRLVLTNSRYRVLYPELADVLHPGTSRAEIREQFVRSNAATLVTSGTPEHLHLAVDPTHSDGAAESNEIHLPDGRWLELRSSTTPDNWTIVLSIDVTSHKLAENSLAALRDQLEVRVADRTRALKGAQAELMKSERLATIGRLAATVSHELRNPLGALRNAVFLLRRRLDETDGRLSQYLTVIDRELNNSSRIIDDLLETTRTKPPHLTEVEIGRIVRDTVTSLSLPDTLRVDCPARSGLVPVEVDELQFRQVLGNLITNAAQAMNHRGTVSIDAARSEDGVIITVTDDGPGIAEEFRERVFEPLFTTRSKGNGLGLWISREIVHRHGGELSLDDSTGRGARFAIRLPATASSNHDRAAE